MSECYSASAHVDSSCTKMFLSLAVNLGLSWIPILISLPSSEPITKLWGFVFSVSFLSYKPGLGSEMRT